MICEVPNCDEPVCDRDFEFEFPAMRCCQKHSDIIEDFIEKEDGIGLFKWYIRNVKLPLIDKESR